MRLGVRRQLFPGRLGFRLPSGPACAVLGAVLVSLILALPWEPDATFGFPPAQPVAQSDVRGPAWTRSTVRFPSQDGTHCEGWLYLPLKEEGTSKPPVVLMASGLGAQRDLRLPSYAEHFSEAGYAVLLFDYRHWGGSDGQPRHVVHPYKHQQDYLHAAMHVLTTRGFHDKVNASRIILWGTSYSGGHALLTASKLADAGAGQNVAAVVVMEPFFGARLLARGILFLTACPVGRASTAAASCSLTPDRHSSDAAMGTAASLGTCSEMAADHKPRKGVFANFLRFVVELIRGVRLLLAGLSDAMRGALGLPAAYVPLVAPASEVIPANAIQDWLNPRNWMGKLSMGVLTDDDYHTFMAARPPHMLGGWQNLVAARLVFIHLFYHPLAAARSVPCPVLVVAGRQDTLTPTWTIQKGVAHLRKKGVLVEYEELDGTHITLYEQPSLIPSMVAFLHRHVPADG